MEIAKTYPPFSVAMCVYGGDNAEWFDAALQSVVEQTVKPDEIVLVVDGPVPETIQTVIDRFVNICGSEVMNVIYLETNRGHGIARRTSLDNCRNDIVALMDSDDICLPDRFEKQIGYFESSGTDIVGGDIAEFIGEQTNVVAYRRVPSNDADIKECIKKRCPFNQMTVMFRKAVYTEAGGYLDWYCDEDYYLWLRMMQCGAVFANTGDVLVNVRVGEEMYQRRGGWRYFSSEAKLQGYMLKKRIIGIPTYIVNVGKRFVVQVLLPNRLRGWVFRKFARKKS